MWEKKEATGAVGYVMLFTMAIIMVIITFFMLASAKLMTIQHDVDDALADSVLASLVADDIYYFETWEGTGTAVIRFRNLDESYRLYRDCMKDAIESKEEFYGNIQYPVFICYEVEGGRGDGYYLPCVWRKKQDKRGIRGCKNTYRENSRRNQCLWKGYI